MDAESQKNGVKKDDNRKSKKTKTRRILREKKLNRISISPANVDPFPSTATVPALLTRYKHRHYNNVLYMLAPCVVCLFRLST